MHCNSLLCVVHLAIFCQTEYFTQQMCSVIKGMHGDHNGVMVAPYASTHIYRVLIQHHGALGFVHPRVSNINHTASTPKCVIVAPYF